MIIPKNIYITHETHDHIFNFENQIKKTIINNPTYKVIFYNNNDRADFIKKDYPEFYEYYSKIHNNYGAMKADIFRVLILHKYGGIYIDIKSTLYNIDELFKKYPNVEFFTISYNENKIIKIIHDKLNIKYMNYFIASRAGGEIITKIKDEMLKNLRNYKDNIFLRGGIGVFKLTGPTIYNKIINENKSKVVNISDENVIYCKFSNINLLKRPIIERNYFKSSYHFSMNKIFVS